MELFTNETIDTTKLPRYEEVQFTPLHPKYKNVVLWNATIFSSIVVIAFAVYAFFNAAVLTPTNWVFATVLVVVLLILYFFFSLLRY
jgi:hypothetical protein